MAEKQTWRTLLGKVIVDIRERQRIAHLLGIHPVTLVRWTTSKSNPRPDTLHMLLDALPQHRHQLAELIKVEFPHFVTENPSPQNIPQDIPSTFYDRILKAYTTSPPITRTSAIATLILQQLLLHLDPHQTGIGITIATCVPPLHGHKVRSLRQVMGVGTDVWRNQLENQAMFLGAESPTGYAVIKGHRMVIQTRDEMKQLFPTYYTQWEESAIAYPLLQSHRVAGGLYVMSSASQYFSQALQDLIQKYADLLILAFEHESFQPLHNIEIEIMPPYDVQHVKLAEFQERVKQHLIQAVANDQPITRLQAEMLTWQELEESLLRPPFPS